MSVRVQRRRLSMGSFQDFQSADSNADPPIQQTKVTLDELVENQQIRVHELVEADLVDRELVQADARNCFVIEKVRYKCGAMNNSTALNGIQLATARHVLKTKSCVVRVRASLSGEELVARLLICWSTIQFRSHRFPVAAVNFGFEQAPSGCTAQFLARWRSPELRRRVGLRTMICELSVFRLWRADYRMPIRQRSCSRVQRDGSLSYGSRPSPPASNSAA
jgi:hypothetical protein